MVFYYFKSKVFIALLLSTNISLAHANFEARSYDGSGNHLTHSEWGSTDIPLLRIAGSDYADGISAPSGQDRLSPRLISNIVAEQLFSVPNENDASDFAWQWGQFVDHDIDLTDGVDESFPIPVPSGDPFFDPFSTGTQVIPLSRSFYEGGVTSTREQINSITAFIDGSNVYGSDPVRAAALRTFKHGKLKTSRGRFLPYNADGLPNAGGPFPELFLAGDVRANEQIALTAMHTLFVREHNRICDQLKKLKLSDEETYQIARKIVGAQLQVITFNEWLPVILGPNAIPPYSGYDDTVNPGIANSFSTAFFRFGHSMLSSDLLRANGGGKIMESIPLRDSFFNPELVVNKDGIDSLLHGLALQPAQRVDNRVVDAVRNFLFGPPGSGGFDLASLNIQRGRDHGLPDYNAARIALGLQPKLSFSDISSDPDVVANLEAAYASVDAIDPWVGGLAEDHLPEALVGETIAASLIDQFTRLRDGDRFWYANDPFFMERPELVEEIENTKLSDIIRRNTLLGNKLPEDVFHLN